ncbi:MAG: cytochrome ubiquinol oxidase subunit I, partial [Kaistella sp.]|nr:cytochrome ubiquinol oxidase subunit I [Kaistella sp.]
VVHYAFQIMIFFGVVMIIIGGIYLFAVFFKKNWLTKNWLLKMFMFATPFGYIALEAGWTVTEVGRQPWIIYGIMRTADAVTPMPGIQYSFYFFTAIFVSLSCIIIFLLRRQIQMVPKLYDPTDPQFNSKNKPS